MKKTKVISYVSKRIIIKNKPQFQHLKNVLMVYLKRSKFKLMIKSITYSCDLIVKNEFIMMNIYTVKHCESQRKFNA